VAEKTQRIQAPRGTLDWLPPRVELRRRAIEVGRRVLESAGYGEIVTPTFEDTSLFARTSGEGSDVVRKEMYSFRDRSDRDLTLRPEGTAPVVRAFLEHGLRREPLPARVWYVAPMFRYAAVQHGRYREHWQLGAEAIGSDDPAVDAEIIALQRRWYAELGLGRSDLLVNSIGDRACRPAYTAALVEYLSGHRDRLSEDSRERLSVNPLRILDSKDEGDRELLADAPSMADFLCDACREHFDAVRGFLDARGVDYEVDPRLVRGLDYYERTAWEFIPADGGPSLSGGGRYDGLAEQLGGERTPGVGFGCGIERVVLALEAAGHEPAPPACDLFLAIDEPLARPRLHAVLDEARARGLTAQTDLAGRSLKGQLRQAKRVGATILAVCEPADWERGVVRLGEDEVPVPDLVEEVLRRLGRT
jgi:histidyl-tRNA synthetase